VPHHPEIAKRRKICHAVRGHRAHQPACAVPGRSSCCECSGRSCARARACVCVSLCARWGGWVTYAMGRGTTAEMAKKYWLFSSLGARETNSFCLGRTQPTWHQAHQVVACGGRQHDLQRLPRWPSVRTIAMAWGTGDDAAWEHTLLPGIGCGSLGCHAGCGLAVSNLANAMA